MVTDTTPPCANCQRLQAEVDALRTELEALRDVVAQLQRQLAAARKDSSNSSKPPSSDIVKPPKPQPPPGQQRRKPGGQPGHASHQRVPFPPEMLASVPTDYLLDACPSCGGHLLLADGAEPIVIQRVEIAAVPVEIHEHRSHPGWCPCCQRTRYAPFPTSIERGGLAGPRLTTVIAYLKGACHASYSTVRKFVRDVIGLTISRGQLAKIVGKVSRALERPYEELLGDLPGQAVLNVDETGHKHNGQQHWTWCFRAGLYTLFKIDPTRGADVLIEVLGSEFDGVLGCDYFSAYRRYHREFGVVLQFCLAHLIRDVKYLTTLPDARDRAYGEGLREALRDLFAVIHRRGEWTEAEFRRRLGTARDEVLGRGTTNVPATRAATNLARRLEAHGDSYFRFLTEPGIGPTNNLAEQAIRFVVIDRRITQGTRGERGDRWCERIWTVMATCSQQGRSAFEYLEAAVTAWFREAEAPSLLPKGT
jgi:transposase